MTQADFSSTDLFDDQTQMLTLGPEAVRLGGLARVVDWALLAALDDILLASPFRHMTTPGGWRMSVAMTNCGVGGWVSDNTGYRYDSIDPGSRRPWPDMPAVFFELPLRASELAEFPGFVPDVCLVNRYVPSARLSLHQDRDERHFDAPIVSVSLALPAVFLWGGLSRHEKPRRVRLAHGDVVVWGGPSRMAFHSVDTLRAGEHPLTGDVRYNLTFRRASGR